MAKKVVSVEEQYDKDLIVHLLALASVWGLGGLTTEQVSDGVTLTMQRELALLQ